MDRKDYLLLDLKDFCKTRSSLSAKDQAQILASIKLTEKMFEPKNNIFVKDKASGKAKYLAIKAAIENAVDAYINTNKSSRIIMGELISKVNDQLAGDKTLGIATAVTMLIPHNENEVFYDAGHDMLKSAEKDIKGLFSKSMVKSDNPLFRQVVSNVSFYSNNNILFVNSMLHQMEEFSLRNTASVDALVKNNRFASLMAEKAMRKVAYENEFKTVADMKLAFMKNRGTAKATKDQLIDQVAKELKKDFAALDDNTLRTIALGAARSDIYGKNTAIVHTAKGGFIFGMELKPALSNPQDKFSLKAGVKLTDGMDLQIQTDGPGRYRFTLGATMGAKLFAEAGLKNQIEEDGPETNVGDAQAEAGGAYKRTYTVTFDNLDKAAVFLGRIMTANLSGDALALSESFNTSHGILAGAHANASLDPVASYQRNQGQEVNSTSKAVVANISAGAGADGEWTYERGVNHYRHSVHSTAELQAGFEMSLSPRNIVLGDADKDKLSAAEKAEYEAKEAQLDFADKFLQFVLDPQKLTKKKFSDPEGVRFIDHLSNHEYTDDEKKEWGKLSMLEKLDSDRNRFFAEELTGFISGSVVDPTVTGLVSLRDALLKKFAGVIGADRLLKSLTEFFQRVSTMLNGPHARFSFEASLGDTSKIPSVKDGAKGTWDSTFSYETNALETSIRSAEKVTAVKVETVGSEDNINIKFQKNYTNSSQQFLP